MNRCALTAGVAAVSLAFPRATAAQRGLSVGASAGLGVARVHGADAEQVDAGTGFAGGAVASLGLSERLGLELDVLYVQKRSAMAVSGAATGTVTYRFNYIEAPVLAWYRLLTGAHLVPTFSVGVAPAFRLNSTRTSATWSGTPGTAPKQFVLPKSADLGVVVGAGAGLATGHHQVRIDARYTHGVINFPDKQFNGTTIVENPDVHLSNGALTVMATYMLEIARPSRGAP